MDTDSLRRDAEAIFRAGLRAADAGLAVSRHLHREGKTISVGGMSFSLDRIGRIRVVGMGKASAAMARAVEAVLGDRIDGGLVVVKDGHALPLARIRVREAAHPVPDARGVQATRELMEMVAGSEAGDLLFCLISGGGSALAPAPAPGVALEEIQEVTRLLLASGATIHEMNTIRKHLSRLKGGRLARMTYPATLVSLILSDVVGDDLDTIASGPTVPDGGTYGDCLEILRKRGIRESAPTAVRTLLEAGARGEIPETPKAGDPAFAGARNLIVGSNRMALEASRARAAELGYEVVLPPGLEEGEAREVAQAHVALARKIRESRGPGARPTCILTGGETTVTLRGGGTGGRNQEFVLAAALEMDGMDGVVVLSGGTDGTDGPTDAAGALADGETVRRGAGLGLEAGSHLNNNDAYPLFRRLGDLLMTGPTFTNVMDLRVVLLA
jgi:hydroxypyruvate reductase